MTCKGFITVATWSAADPAELFEQTELHIQIGTTAVRVAPDDDETTILEIYIAEEPDRVLLFSRSEAKDLIQAVQSIVDRFEITPEEWERSIRETPGRSSK